MGNVEKSLAEALKGLVDGVAVNISQRFGGRRRRTNYQTTPSLVKFSLEEKLTLSLKGLLQSEIRSFTEKSQSMLNESLRRPPSRVGRVYSLSFGTRSCASECMGVLQASGPTPAPSEGGASARLERRDTLIQEVRETMARRHYEEAFKKVPLAREH